MSDTGKRKQDKPIDLVEFGQTPAELSLDFTKPVKPIAEAMNLDELPADQAKAEAELPKLNEIKFRDHKSRRKRNISPWLNRLLVLAIALFLCALLWEGLRRFEPAQNWLSVHLKDLAKWSEKNNWGQLHKDIERLNFALTYQEKSDAEDEHNKSWSEMSCRGLVQEALSRRFQQQLDQRGTYLLTNCQLFQDVPQAVVRSLKDKDLEELQTIPDHWSALPAYLQLVEAKRRTQVLASNTPKSFPTCRRWQQSPSCFARFIDQARLMTRSSVESAAQVLSQPNLNVPDLVFVWFYFAAGWEAHKRGAFDQAEAYLLSGSDFFVKIQDPFLTREIFRLRIQNAFFKKDKALFTLIWKTRPKELIEEDEAAFIDASLLRHLLFKPDLAQVALKDFFARPESHQRYRFDPQFISLIVERGIREQLAKESLTYLERMQEMNQPISEGLSEWFPLLKTRVYLALKRGQEALDLLKQLESQFPHLPKILHLKAAAIYQTYKNQAILLLALDDLQKAWQVEPKFENAFALITSLLHQGQINKAEIQLKLWPSKNLKRDELSWRELAEGLILMQKKERAKALDLLQKSIERNPSFSLSSRILKNVEGDDNFLKSQILNDLIPLLPVDGPLAPLALFP